MAAAPVTCATPPVALIPLLRVAVERFLARSRFSTRTRESYAQDLAPLLAHVGNQPVATALTHAAATAFLATQEHLAASTYNRRYAALRSLVRWCQTQGYLADNPLVGLERRPQGKGDKPRDMFFSRRVSGYLDAYLKGRGEPTHGPLFVTARKARNPRHADLTAKGYARLSYRQADTLWKGYTPGWDLHQLRHTAISARAAKGYTEVELKRFSGHSSLRSLEVYIAHNRESAKRKAREWERREGGER